MVVNTTGYLIVGAVAFLVTFVSTPIVVLFARRFGLVVEPDERRVHTRPTPDVGGIAMFAGFLAAMFIASKMGRFGELFASNNSEPLGVVLACSAVFAVGLIDDIHEISAPAKIAGTVVGGVLLVVFGVTMFFFRVPLWDVFVLSPDWAPLITVLWLIGMTNAVNLIDGLDGLAAGIVAIAAGSYFLYSHHLDQEHFLKPPNIGPLIAIIAVGVCLGFLPHNFNPAKIFMGDGGALLLGALMAVSTSVVGGRADPNTQQQFRGQTFFFYAPLFIPLVILGVPILDTLFAIVRRARKGGGLATADKGHLHHRLMNLGHGQRRSVMILWLWTALLSGFVLYPAFSQTGNAVVPLGIAAAALMLYTILHPQIRRRAQRDEFVRPDDVTRKTDDISSR